jgi:hypothetical protein
VTVREWFRWARAAHVPSSHTEEDLVHAVRLLDWRLVEFYLLRYLSAVQVDPEAHHWVLEEYTFECARCEASVPREIDETDPPQPDLTCHCRACRPCEGRPA